MKFAEWLERFAVAFAFFFLGKKAGSQEEDRLKSELGEAKLNLKMRDNQDEVDTKYADMSDTDIIDDAIKSGRSKMPRRK